jgi:putative colanic acid biosynthesis glycosyltransferase
MNKGAARSKGRWVLFLNAGDLLFAPITLGLLCQSLESAKSREVLMAAASRRYPDGSTRLRRPLPVGYILHGLPAIHQAIVYPRLAVLNSGYDPFYRVAGDYALTASLWRQGMRFRRLPFTLASFETGGVSLNCLASLDEEADRVQREVLGLPVLWRLLSRSFRQFSHARLLGQHEEATSRDG